MTYQKNVHPNCIRRILFIIPVILLVCGLATIYPVLNITSVNRYNTNAREYSIPTNCTIESPADISEYPYKYFVSTRYGIHIIESKNIYLPGDEMVCYYFGDHIWSKVPERQYDYEGYTVLSLVFIFTIIPVIWIVIGIVDCTSSATHMEQADRIEN